MIEVKKLRKKFGELTVLDSLSHKVKEGKITALIGPNGSGKTTLFNIITGTIKQDKGSVYLGNANISSLEAWQVSNAGISRTFQQLSYFQNLSLLDHLLLCFDDNTIFDFFKKGKKEDKTKRVKEILRLVGISKPLDSMVCDLSYGQKKLVGIAMALLKEHKILLLDEPVAGVNPILKNKIKDVLIKLKEKGETIFVIEHDMGFVKEIADEIIVIDKGSIIAKGSPSSVFREAKVIKAYLGA